MKTQTSRQGSSQQPSVMLRDFTSRSALAGWEVANDGVMGGRSQSTFRSEGGHALFSGTVSPDNGGGFASARAPVVAGVTAGCAAVHLRVRGDGKRYQFRVRTDKRWDGPAYKHQFVARGGQWQNVALLFSDFEAAFRGRTVPGAPPIDAGEIYQIGLLVADRQFGPFKLEVAWIKAVR